MYQIYLPIGASQASSTSQKSFFASKWVQTFMITFLRVAKTWDFVGKWSYLASNILEMHMLGVFQIIQDICCNIGTFKIEDKMCEKIDPKVGNPHP